jgi:hypothetical protein
MGSDESLGGVARRWFRAKTTELLTGNRNKRDSAAAESQNAQREAADRVSSEVLMTAFPGLRRAQERQEERKRESAARERAEILALPRARVDLTLSGGVSGSWSGELPIRVEKDDPEDGTALAVELAVLEDEAPTIAGQPWRGLRFVVPDYHGPADYDLVALGRAAEAAGNEFDYQEWEFALGNWDEPFFWTPDVGEGAITVGADERAFTVRLAMQSPGDRVTLDGRFHLI